MAKGSKYVCSQCGYETPRWLGKCPECGQWNTLEEKLPEIAGKTAPGMQVKESDAPLLWQVDTPQDERVSTGIEEFDRVLGGGVVTGSLLLLGGDPGIGKSTLLLQVSHHLSQLNRTVLYVSGEESLHQLRMRAQRLGIASGKLHATSQTNMDAILALTEKLKPHYLIVDSIQTMFLPQINTAPGSVSQIRQCAAAFLRLAKEKGVTVFLIGHVTKEGTLAGPRILEHMVDAVLNFEGDHRQDYRILRAAKNRFGSINEIGIFRMTAQGMQAVPNPSEFLLSHRLRGAAGSAVTCSMEGSRPVLVDIQSLVAPSLFGMPRRQSDGFDHNRMSLLLAVMEKRAGIPLYNQDAYINVAGGLTLEEPAVDLTVTMAVASSARNVPVPPEWVILGEVGLTGEVRAISQIERRLSEAARMGFTRALIPAGNLAGLKPIQGITCEGVDTLYHAFALVLGSQQK